jgi:GT2 family glycosyltransferase
LGASYLSRGFVGIAKRETHAYNSGSIFRVSALKQIGGFNPCFWLDYQDAYVYRQLYLHGRKVYVAGDIQVEHELSLLHGDDLRADRFWNYLLAESAFWDLYGGRPQGIVLTGRLLCRIWRQRKRGHAPAIRRLTWDALKRRVFQSRMRRIRDWESEMESRMRSLSGAEPGRETSEERPAISVCMAAYNGERYITEQLQSILSQLAEEDEVIVVDDASTDGTRQCVRSLQDKRIQIIEHTLNLGVSPTFEDAIRATSNSIIFLSDQDDVWVSNKVHEVMMVFNSDPRVTLITSDNSLIDVDGNVIKESYFMPMGGFSSGFLANLIHNRYGGCNMAFRASILSEILPLPRNYGVLHDVWIGMRNLMSGGKTHYIDKVLVVNRRHDNTVTGKRLSYAERVRVRINLLYALFYFSVQKRIGRL